MDFNFIHEANPESDRELFFGPLSGEEFIVFDDSWTMADILVTAGIFPSKGQARKNTPDLTIPKGFSDFTRTKRKIRITILNKIEE